MSDDIRMKSVLLVDDAETQELIKVLATAISTDMLQDYMRVLEKQNEMNRTLNDLVYRLDMLEKSLQSLSQDHSAVSQLGEGLGKGLRHNGY